MKLEVGGFEKGVTKKFLPYRVEHCGWFGGYAFFRSGNEMQNAKPTYNRKTSDEIHSQREKAGGAVRLNESWP